jgi:spore coat polysaccharide biosynthesis protein SpsF
MRTVAIIQARMGSTRLPGKVLRLLDGEPMLACVVARTLRARAINQIVIATTDLPEDDAIAAYCGERQWPVFRGSSSDVLSRYLGAALEMDADVIVRITSDCPLIEPTVIDRVLEEYFARQGEVDYACNILPARTYPRGLDCEVFSRQTLEICAGEAKDASSREHVTAFIYAQPGRFRLHGVTAGQDFSDHRWTVDTPEDWAFVEAVYRHFRHDHFSWREVLQAEEENPQWRLLNRHVKQKAL